MIEDQTASATGESLIPVSKIRSSEDFVYELVGRLRDSVVTEYIGKLIDPNYPRRYKLPVKAGIKKTGEEQNGELPLEGIIGDDPQLAEVIKKTILPIADEYVAKVGKMNRAEIQEKFEKRNHTTADVVVARLQEVAVALEPEERIKVQELIQQQQESAPYMIDALRFLREFNHQPLVWLLRFDTLGKTDIIDTGQVTISVQTRINRRNELINQLIAALQSVTTQENTQHSTAELDQRQASPLSQTLGRFFRGRQNQPKVRESQISDSDFSETELDSSNRQLAEKIADVLIEKYIRYHFEAAFDQAVIDSLEEATGKLKALRDDYAAAQREGREDSERQELERLRQTYGEVSPHLLLIALLSKELSSAVRKDNFGDRFFVTQGGENIPYYSILDGQKEIVRVYEWNNPSEARGGVSFVVIPVGKTTNAETLDIEVLKALDANGFPVVADLLGLSR